MPHPSRRKFLLGLIGGAGRLGLGALGADRFLRSRALRRATREGRAFGTRVSVLAFHADAALLTAVKIKAPFRIAKCQHFVGSDERMVVTRADPLTRKVYELNGEPAAREYARLLNLPEQLLP